MTAKEKKSLLFIDDVTANWKKKSVRNLKNTDRMALHNSDE